MCSLKRLIGSGAWLPLYAAIANASKLKQLLIVYQSDCMRMLNQTVNWFAIKTLNWN